MIQEEDLEISGNSLGQAAFMADCSPGSTLLAGGLGSGKTFAGARKFLWLHAHNECPGMAVAPTFPDLFRIMVPELMAVAEEWGWEAVAYAGGHGQLRFPHLVIEGNPIYLMSAEAAERIAGFEVGHIWVDEAARIQEVPTDPRRDAPTQIRSRLRHKSAQSLHMLCTTTPEGIDTWTHRDWFIKPVADHRAYIVKTTENAALPSGYIDALRSAYGAELAQQYIDGIAVNYAANRAHPTFTTANIRALKIENAPLHVCCDYNVSPMCWSALQLIGEEVRVVDELIVEDFAMVDAMVHAAHLRKWGAGKVVFHPDKSAKARSTVGDSEYFVMAKAAKELGWNYSGDAFGVNPPVNARINNLSRLILDGNGKRRLIVNDSCIRTIDEMNRTARASNGYDPGLRGDRGHILDAIGYGAWDISNPWGVVAPSTLKL